MNGFERALKEDILSLVPHISLSQASAVEDIQPLLKQVQAQPSVSSVSAFSMAPIMLAHRQQLKPVLLYGVDLQSEASLKPYKRFLDNFDWTSLQQDQVLVASGLADTMGLEVGQSLQLMLSDKHRISEKLKIKTVKLAGVFHSGTELDQKLILASNALLADIKAYPQGAVDGLRIQIHELGDSRRVARELSLLTGLYYFRDWSMTQGNLYHAVQLSKKLVVLLTIIIIAVAAFNVVSTLLLYCYAFSS